MKHGTWAGLVLALALLCFAGGVLFERTIGIRRLVDWIGLTDRLAQFEKRDPGDRTAVSWPSVAKGRTMVALVLGQSNAANSGETQAGESPGVYEFYRGRMYAARDPLLGADGDGGSVWMRLAARAIDRGAYDTIVLVPLAAGGSEIQRWTPGGDLHPRLLSVVDEARGAQLQFTHVLWHQGEADAMRGTTARAYEERFRLLVSALRARGVTAPIYVARASRCARHHPSDEIRQAQQALVERADGVFAGPDTDILGFGDRYDGCHFTTEGLERAAVLWLQAILQHAGPANVR